MQKLHYDWWWFYREYPDLSYEEAVLASLLLIDFVKLKIQNYLHEKCN